MRYNVKNKKSEFKSSKISFYFKRYKRNKIRNKYRYIMIILSKLLKITLKTIIDSQQVSSNTNIE